MTTSINRSELIVTVVDLLFELDARDSHQYQEFLNDEGISVFSEVDTLEDKKLIDLGQKLSRLLGRDL